MLEAMCHRNEMKISGMHEHREGTDMNLEDRDVTDEDVWRRNVRPRLELEQDCILL